MQQAQVTEREIQALGERFERDVRQWRQKALGAPQSIIGVSMAFHVDAEDFHYAPTLWGLHWMARSNSKLRRCLAAAA
jgi:hypothetical protein